MHQFITAPVLRAMGITLTQQKFITHLFSLWLCVRGRFNFTISWDLTLKAKISQLLLSIAIFLNASVSIEVKRKVAQAFYEMPDMKYYPLYIKHLKSPDKVISAYMSYALGEKLKTKQAVPALIEVADPEKYPESYGSALRALIEIGDPSAIPAIRKIAESAPSEDYRNYAKRGLKKLTEQQAATP